MLEAEIIRTLGAYRRIGVVAVDRELKVVHLAGSLRWLGWEAEDCVGCALTEILPELVGSEQALREVLEGSSDACEFPWMSRADTQAPALYLSLTTLPWRDQAGAVKGLWQLIEDVTAAGTVQQQVVQQRNELRLARYQLQQRNLALAAANAELRQLDLLKSRFVGMAAHELRNPLTSMLGYVDLLLDGAYGPLQEEQCDRLELISDSAERLQRLIQGLLDLTRIETGMLDLLLQPCDLAAILASALGASETFLQAKSQSASLSAGDAVPQALCDPGRTAQVVANLLTNASKYSPEASHIEVDLDPDIVPGFVRVSVLDHGIGISAEDAPHVFEPFFRGRMAREGDNSGAGLGLAIAKMLVELHGGKIWFESEQGVGTTFFLTLPVAEVGEADG
jgi:signal transduction histidine kinase